MAHTWQRRDPEWIKENPGKGTMYKVDENGNEVKKGEEDKIIIKREKFKREGIPDAGTYAIICEKEKYVYVGQSISVATRLRSHKWIICKPFIPTEGNYGAHYVLMHEHFKKHGMEGFEFAKQKPLPGATNSELLFEEVNTMIEFLEQGYKPYNHLASYQMIRASIFCPEKFRPEVELLIQGLIKNKVSIESVKQLTEALS
jgi:hypothetical protein